MYKLQQSKTNFDLYIARVLQCNLWISLVLIKKNCKHFRILAMKVWPGTMIYYDPNCCSCTNFQLYFIVTCNNTTTIFGIILFLVVVLSYIALNVEARLSLIFLNIDLNSLIIDHLFCSSLPFVHQLTNRKANDINDFMVLLVFFLLQQSLSITQGGIKNLKRQDCVVDFIFSTKESFFLGCCFHIFYLKKKLVVVYNLAQLATTFVRQFIRAIYNLRRSKTSII